MQIKSGLLSILFLAIGIGTNANVTLPSLFSDHMVIEQKTKIKVWGWAKPKEKVTVTPSWNDESVTIEAAPDATWSVEILTPEAGGPYEMNIKGYNEINISDILVGEVWLCSGQSNMEWSVGAGFIGKDEVVKNASHNEFRFFNVDYRTATTPQHDVSGRWVVCSPSSVQACSAIGYFIGSELNSALGVPVGIVNSSWGGTPIESWTDKEPYQMCDYLKKQNELLPDNEWGPVRPGLIYNAMISPMGGYAFAGIAWYQGEHNVTNAQSYTDMMYPLVDGFRRLFGNNLPFIYAQIAPYKYGDNFQGVELRDRQRLSLKIPNTAMVVLSDIGDTTDIHPRLKQEAGIRFANAILNKAYGKTDKPLMGPVFKSMTVVKNRAEIAFDYSDGLCCKGKKLTWFEVSDNGRDFVKANAVIKNNKVIVSSPKVKSPVAVRFAWGNTAVPNLFNGAGLPASCFNTSNE